MKNKFVLYTAGAVILNIQPCSALSIDIENPIDCFECTDTLTGQCNRIDQSCCAPCNTGGLIPISCDASTCSGTIVTNGDTCTKTETKGCKGKLCSTVSTTTKCNKGYYGAAPSYNATSKTCTGCEPCPGAGTTTGAGATAAFACYLPSGTPFSDATGSGIYGSDCYWAN